MRAVPLMFGFAAGCVVTTLVGLLAVDVSAQDDASIQVCVAADSTLRLPTTASACAPGQQTLQFKQFDPKDQSGGKENQNNATDKGRLEALAARIKTLEDAAAGGKLTNRVVAPFEVVDRGGNRVFYVEKQDDGTAMASLFNNAGANVARVVATSFGGQLVGSSPVAGPAAYIGVTLSGKASGITLIEGRSANDHTTRTTLGKDAETGRYFLKLFGVDGKPVAAIGQNEANTGSAQVADAAGNPRALLSVGKDGKGRVDILVNSGETRVATLTEGNYGGQLLIFGSSGAAPPMVTAGVTDKGVGLVEAGPYQFAPGHGLLGLPASFISGKPSQ